MGNDNITEPWQKVLNDNRGRLINRMDNGAVVRGLRQLEIITNAQKQECEINITEIKKNDTLVDILLRKTEKDFQQFLTILRSREGLLRYLADELEDELKRFRR